MRKTPAMFDFPMSLMLAEGKVERGDGQKKAIRIRGWSVGSEGALLVYTVRYCSLMQHLTRCPHRLCPAPLHSLPLSPSLA